MAPFPSCCSGMELSVLFHKNIVACFPERTFEEMEQKFNFKEFFFAKNWGWGGKTSVISLLFFFVENLENRKFPYRLRAELGESWHMGEGHGNLWISASLKRDSMILLLL